MILRPDLSDKWIAFAHPTILRSPRDSSEKCASAPNLDLSARSSLTIRSSANNDKKPLIPSCDEVGGDAADSTSGPVTSGDAKSGRNDANTGGVNYTFSRA